MLRKRDVKGRLRKGEMDKIWEQVKELQRKWDVVNRHACAWRTPKGNGTNGADVKYVNAEEKNILWNKDKHMTYD